jgi:hypothetical protein
VYGSFLLILFLFLFADVLFHGGQFFHSQFSTQLALKALPLEENL